MAKRELTTMQTSFLEALANSENKGDIRTCMRLAGYSDNMPAKELVTSLREEMILIAKDMMASASVKATIGLIDVLDSPSALGAKNTVAAAKEILDRAGINKPEANQTTIKADHIFILPPKD